MQLFIYDYQPFSVVEDGGFQAFVAGLNPAYHLPDRKVLSNNLFPALFETCQVKTIVSHYKKSVKATERLVLYQKQNGVVLPKKVLQDVSTRSNSTLKMLEHFIQLEDAIKATMTLSDEKWQSLTPEEWRICREMCLILRPFDQLTETMSAEKYVSGSQILILTRGLVSALTKMLE
ncbi:unnamed protein product [Euphydryas editha]|uniref:Uncharacterized protein n=1 Tax=Euphydryas editha TaxID=104508 RepID=A0AAU9TTC5_EUPED|nr:unnamed protein product [Euphydryas editha]